MAFMSTRICFPTLLLSALQITLLFPATAGQYVSFWGPWSECSKKCDGEQKRTRQCIHPSAKCEDALEDKRECSQTSWSAWCFSEVMIIALAAIGTVIILAVIIVIVLCCRNRNGKEKQKHQSENMSETIEQRYDDSISTSRSVRHFPSAGSFPEPLKEPEDMALDNFAFDQESLNESIHEMAITFGTDEEYLPGKAQQEEEKKQISLKVVSVTETQAIDRDGGLKVKENTSPIYTVVMKPKHNNNYEDVAL